MRKGDPRNGIGDGVKGREGLRGRERLRDRRCESATVTDELLVRTLLGTEVPYSTQTPYYFIL